jgi:hypothetical protein
VSLSDHARANREAWGAGRCGFTVTALHELQAPEGATSRYDFVTPEWARRWPSEEIWVARLGP